MKAKVHNVVVTRDVMTKPSKQVWDWELPVLEEQFPDGLVEVNDSFEVEISEPPDASAEYARLGIVYREDPDTGQSRVALAYGRGRSGVKALEKKIKAAIKKPGKKKTVAKKAAVDDSPEDPLA
jgi:hypothetical protein